MSGLLDALFKTLAVGEKLASFSPDFESRSSSTEEPGAAATPCPPSAAVQDPRMPVHTKPYPVRTDRRPSSRATVPYTISEASPVLPVEEQTSASDSDTKGHAIKATPKPVGSPSDADRSASDTSREISTAETSFESSYSTPEQQVYLGPQSLPFALQRRAQLGVSADTAPTPSKIFRDPPVRKPIKIESPYQDAGEVALKPTVRKFTVPIHMRHDDNKENTPEPAARPPVLSKWRQEQLARLPVPKIIDPEPKPIPILHGPPSLPYARNPSGVEAPMLDSSDYLPFASMTEPDLAELIRVPYFSPPPQKATVVIRKPTQPPADIREVNFKPRLGEQLTASQILRAQLQQRIAQNANNALNARVNSVVTLQSDTADHRKPSEESTRAGKEDMGLACSQPPMQAAKRLRSNTAVSKADSDDNWRTREAEQTDATKPTQVLSMEELMSMFHGVEKNKPVVVKPPPPSTAELKQMADTVTPSKSNIGPLRDVGRSQTAQLAGTPVLQPSKSDNRSNPNAATENDENDSGLAGKLATKARGTPNAGHLLKKHRVSSRSGSTRATPPLPRA